MYTEIVLSWAGDVVEVRRLSNPERFTIGSDATDDLFVPLGDRKSHVLLAKGADGRVWFQPLHGMPCPLETDQAVQCGPFVVEVRTAEKQKLLALLPSFDSLWANTATVTMTAMVAFVAVASLLPNNEQILMEPLSQPRIMTLLKMQPQKKPIEVDLPQEKSARTTDKKQRGNPKESVNDQRAASALQALDALEPGGSMSALTKALDDISNTRTASLLPGGLTTKDGPPGGNDKMYGIGGIHTRRKGWSDGDVDLGGGTLCGKDKTSCKPDYEVTVTQGEEKIIGTPDKEIIRRVVREHMQQVRYCYESKLQSSPGLEGKVAMEWIISPNGVVTIARPLEGSLSKSVGNCLADKIKTWVFPKAPPGVGPVVVKYPFLFKQS